VLQIHESFALLAGFLNYCSIFWRRKHQNQRKLLVPFQHL